MLKNKTKTGLKKKTQVEKTLKSASLAYNGFIRYLLKVFLPNVTLFLFIYFLYQMVVSFTGGDYKSTYISAICMLACLVSNLSM